MHSYLYLEVLLLKFCVRADLTLGGVMLSLHILFTITSFLVCAQFVALTSNTSVLRGALERHLRMTPEVTNLLPEPSLAKSWANMCLLRRGSGHLEVLFSVCFSVVQLRFCAVKKRVCPTVKRHCRRHTCHGDRVPNSSQASRAAHLQSH